MSQNRFVMPPGAISSARRRASKMVKNYEDGLDNASLAFSSHGAEHNIDLQTKAKLAEVTFAMWAGENPKTAVHWADGADNGFDVKTGCQYVDVKHTSLRGQYLIWPVRKRDIFHSKPFNSLVLVKSDNDIYYVWCWLPKDEFFQKKLVAGSNHLLTTGTWFVHEKDCRKMDSFPRQEMNFGKV